MSWPEPPDEAERVRVLHSLDVLDVPKQEEFERITSLCGAALDVPVCLVSLVDAQRQWFLSNRGLGDVRETGRELAFCGHAIMPRSDGGLHSDEPVDVFVVRDAEADDRFRTNSLVTGWPHIRFYAGTALRVAGSDGVKRAIGTLCVIDTAVEHGGTGARCADAFGAREKQILMDFGALVVGAIEGRTAAKRTLAMAKNDYISCTAHDIRTPVACFQLSLELLAASPLSDEQREYVTDAQLCVEVITETVERAIETARQQRGAAPSPARRERVDVRGLVARVDALTKALSAQRPPLNLCVADSVPEHVASDGTLLWRCLLNYVTNAIKATPDATKSVDVAFSVVSMDRTGVTPPSTCASLLCRAGEALGPAPGEDGFPDAPEDDENVVALAPHEAPASGRWLKLEVADQGAGVPRACATMLSGACGTRPRRCHAPASPPKKKKAKLVSALDATLPATESPPAPSRPRLEQPPGDDEGSVFWLLVPLEEVTDDLEDHSSTSSRALPPAALPPPRPVNAPDVAPPAPPKPRHEALIVEDSSPIRKMLKRILERCEFAVDEAGNGEQGLALLCKQRYDIAIMDFLMPIMDGVTCTKKFRQWEAADRARAAAGRCLIVGSSANADAEDIKHAYESGLDDFVPKPVNVTALRTMLAKHGLLPADAPTAPAPA
ncbi:phosphorelay sensor kinase [Aureococcus anophagefferens]|nr:phosphorelay sensor kinase [Aureococcus anophagefferens]